MILFRIASLLTVVTFFNLLSLYVKISHVFKYYSHYLSTNVWGNPVSGEEYNDFIVVGAGSAGSVVANRLSKHNKVLLIEAGGTPFYANHIPAMATQLIHTPEVDYMYKTVPQKNGALGSIEQSSFWPRGKILGGSSNLNYMMYVRAHPFDYDNWANLTKDESWSYKNLLRHFKRSIDYHGDFSDDDTNYGYSYGTQHVEPFQKPEPLYNVFMNAGKELGFETKIDLNGPQRTGFGPADASQRNGKRETSYTAFLEPILDRENLVISKYSQAVKIHLDKSNRAVGVWYMQHGNRKYARATKEVIVSGGSVDSPKLLMLSGIGPKEHLKQLGIKPRIDLPVGQNLKDHVITFLMPFTTNRTVSYNPDRDLGIFDMIEYYTKGTGVLTLPLGSYSQAFFTSDLAKKQSGGMDWTDFQMLAMNVGPYELITSDLSKVLKLRQEILENLFRESIRDEKDGFMVCMALGRPKSTGSITLASKDPSVHPVIDPKYLSHPDDISRYVEAVKFAMKMVETTKSFQELNATYTNAHLDECKEHKFKSDKYWECYLRHVSFTMYHPVSTCKMGAGLGDKTSVVDSKLRVLHTKGLRVADASIMPDLVNGNTNAPAVMIGEKGADIIREYWAKQYQVCSKAEILYRKNLSRETKCFYSKMV